MPKNLTYLLLLICLLVSGFLESTNAQTNGYEFANNSSQTDAHQKALDNANLEPYRLQKSERVLKFEDGVEFTLTSAEQLVASSIEINPENYPTEESLNKGVSLIFKLGPNSQVAVRSEVNSDSKLAKIGKGFPAHKIQIISQEDFDKMGDRKQEIIRSRPHQYRVE